jgi:hypothetical protein
LVENGTGHSQPSTQNPTVEATLTAIFPEITHE